MPIIEVKQLTRSFRTQHKEPGLWNSVKGLIRPIYEEVQAVKGISFQIEKGELVGFLGPNGAGKTTTLKMLSGLLYPTSGTAHVLNHIPWERKDTYRRQFSLVMGQKNQLWWDLPAMESLLLNKEVYSVPDAKFKAMVDELVSLLDVAHKLHVPVRELSLGERMKLELIAALLFSPSVIFLDEPTIGLDVISQKKVRDFVRYYNDREKATIILTSHYMSDIEELCKRVIIIDHGVLLYDGDLKGILERFANYKIMTLISETPINVEDINKYGELVSNMNDKTIFKVKRNMVAQASGELLNQYQIKDLSIEEVPIEDVVRDIFGNQEKI